MTLDIHPYVGVGPLKFGMSVTDIRNAMNAPVKSFKKSPSSEMDVDDFSDLGIHVHYRSPGICEAIELAKPAAPIFQWRDLLNQPFSKLREWFDGMDENLEVDEAGLTSYKFGIGLYAPFAEDEPDGQAESVIVFERGYYDRK